MRRASTVVPRKTSACRPPRKAVITRRSTSTMGEALATAVKSLSGRWAIAGAPAKSVGPHGERLRARGGRVARRSIRPMLDEVRNVRLISFKDPWDGQFLKILGTANFLAKVLRLLAASVSDYADTGLA
jgi:hypothetical protein